MPKLRAKRSGRYKYGSIKGTVEKENFLKDYYKKHKKAVDKAVENYKKSKGITTTISNEKLFVDKLKYGRDWGSTKQARMAVERTIVSLNGEDAEWYDAKHGSNKQIFGDLRKLNKFKAKYTDYKFTDASGDWGVEGYYETTNPDIVIANKTVYPSKDSPYSYWEYMKKDEIGL